MSDLILSRRKFLVLASSFMAVAATPGMASSLLPKAGPRFSSRNLSLLNVHTQETFEGAYWREGQYEEKALKRLAYLLRDRRNQEQHPIDPQLFDVLHRIQANLGKKEEFQVICGYRSKKTNAALRKQKRGVAKKSRHMEGKAIDLNLAHTPLKELRDVARSLKAGGVGYYPKSHFVHIDVRPKPAYWS